MILKQILNNNRLILSGLILSRSHALYVQYTQYSTYSVATRKQPPRLSRRVSIAFLQLSVCICTFKYLACIFTIFVFHFSTQLNIPLCKLGPLDRSNPLESSSIGSKQRCSCTSVVSLLDVPFQTISFSFLRTSQRQFPNTMISTDQT